MEPAGIIALVAGILLLSAGFLDALVTTTAISEWPGPLTRLLSTTLWRGVRVITSRSRSVLLRAAGPLVVVSVVTGWVLALWFGWTLIFAAVPGSVVEAQSGQAASFASKFYFTATSMVTTGVGDFIPSSDGWRIVTGTVSVSGLILITLVITYLIPVISAAVDRGRLAKVISAYGGSPAEILARHWDGSGFSPLLNRADQLTRDIVALRSEHLAYPVLHFFHDADPERALAPRIAALDEALTVLEHGVPPNVRPPERAILPLREVIGALLVTVVSQAFARPRGDVPPPPDLQAVRDAGVPTVSDRQFEASLARLGERRAKLLSYVRDDSWDWEEVFRAPASAEKLAS